MKKEKKFLWASVHKPTEEQLEYLTGRGEVEFLKEVNPDLFKELVDSPPLRWELEEVAERLVAFCNEKYKFVVQPAGSPAQQVVLGSIKGRTFGLSYAISERVSVDKQNEDGTVTKVSIFKHLGWTTV